jgi:AcrR family transcriptional regulator
MSDIKQDTEKNILAAASRVFIRKGMGGTRMQEIADEAQINKSLLHYYYRSKQLLFEAVFKNTVAEFILIIKEIFNSEEDLRIKIPKIVQVYTDYLKKNPYIISFILRELQAEPKIILKIIEMVNIKSLYFFEQIKENISSGKIKPIKPEDLFVNILSLTIFPIVAKPIVKAALMQNDSEKYNDFLEERKKTICEFIFSSIY